MSQTLAIFLDQYRALKARKMFWIVLAISGLVVGLFGAVGINDKGLTLLGYSMGMEMLSTQHISQALFYKTMFSTFGIGYWLSWLAALLALISTAGIFPEFVSSGAIDLTLSKPITRIRLFGTQYLAALLFVTLQVGIFCVASFFVLGLRGGVWAPWLFLAIPLVVCLFSYLFSVCVLLGVWTRSAIAAILLTLLFWFFLSIASTSEAGLIMAKVQQEQRNAQVQKELQSVQKQIRVAERAPKASTEPTTNTVTGGLAALKTQVQQLQQQYDERSGNVAALSKWCRGLHYARTFLPKTGDTVTLLERALIEKADMPKDVADNKDVVDNRDPGKKISDKLAKETSEKIAKELQGRSVAWVLGTSLAFEAVVLALACFIFCRRDY